MKKAPFILTLTIGMMLIGCKGQTEEAVHEHEHATEVEKDEHVEDFVHEESDVIQLNNGQKWLVNIEMKPFILKGSELVKNYIQSGSKDYKKLAKQLTEQNDKLINSCTMEGKSHDELHKWLHPHLAMVAALAELEDKAEAERVVKQIEESYYTYAQYFQ